MKFLTFTAMSALIALSSSVSKAQEMDGGAMAGDSMTSSSTTTTTTSVTTTVTNPVTVTNTVDGTVAPMNVMSMPSTTTPMVPMMVPGLMVEGAINATTVPVLLPTSTPTTTIIRRYLDSNGNVSAADIRYSGGNGTGTTYQVRFSPAMEAGSGVTMARDVAQSIATLTSTNGLIAVPPMFDPDASREMVRGLTLPVGNTTEGTPMIGESVQSMIAGGYISGQSKK